MLILFASFITSFIITYFTIPPIIKVANIRKLFDEPDLRKVHKNTIPALGGVAIFSGVFFSILFWIESTELEQIRWIILSLVIVFLLGLKDDIVSIDPYKKLLGEFFAVGIVVYWGDIRIHSLYGLLSVHELPYIASTLLTFFSIIVIINAFNLIDGIDGLAGGLGTIASITLGTLFLIDGHLHSSLIAFSLAGTLLAFLWYNFSPAKIFMGDGGSLMVGFLLAIMCIKLIDLTIIVKITNLSFTIPTPAVALAILIIPLTDTLRVFIIRIAKGDSPFKADRNHIHHLLLNLGFNHSKSSILLWSINITFIVLTLIFNMIEINTLFIFIGATAFSLSKLPSFIFNNKKQLNSKKQALQTYSSANREAS